MDRPRCITYNMASVDGRLTIAPGVSLLAGDPRWDAATAGLGDPYDWVRRVHDPQVLLEGSGSFLSDGGTSAGSDVGPPEGTDGGTPAGAHARIPTEPEPDSLHHLPPGVVDVPGRRWFAVVDGRGRVDLQFTEWPDPAWAGWHALVLTSRAAPVEHLVGLRERGIPYVVVGQSHVDLPAAMELLGSRLGVRTVVCTGGGRLGGAMLRAGLVDEIDLDVLPVAIGGRGTPALFDAPPLGADEWPTPLALKSAEAFADGRVRLRYEVRS
ncbi:MAG: dihydrofolate reductase family protein [Candidatus Nanopelagicales bacterium]